MKPRASNAVELADIEITFPRGDDEPLRIVNGLDLRIDSGMIHCLAGRSGSGKTSLLRVIVGTLRAQSGTIAWAGTPLADLGADDVALARRDHMSYVDQGATIIPELTALDNVLVPAIPAGVSKEIERRARELLALFGLESRVKQRARTLSGGERQRLAIARALLLSPTAIALDEPTASLDRDAAHAVIDALREAADHGAAVIVASHDPDVIAAADSITRLD